MRELGQRIGGAAIVEVRQGQRIGGAHQGVGIADLGHDVAEVVRVGLARQGLERVGATAGIWAGQRGDLGLMLGATGAQDQGDPARGFW